MRISSNNCFARVMSMLLVLVFVFTMAPVSLVMADTDYTMTLTADKTEYAAGETVTLTVTIDGLMNDVSIVQYEIAYDEALVSTDTSGKNPKCFDADWYAEIKAETGLGYINTPVKSAVDGVFKAGFLSNDMYSIDSEADLYGKETAVAGKILFTVNADIADVSKVFTLQNTKIAQAIGGANVEKTVTAVQLKAAGSSEPEVPEVDKAVEAAIAAIAAIGEVAYTEQCEALIVAAENACEGLTETQLAAVTNYDDLQKARKTYDELKAVADKIAADKAEAAAVDALIAAIPAEITLSDEAAIVAAREAYDALSADAVGYVKNLAALEAAETALEELKKPVVPDEPTYDTDYAMILTADKAEYAAGETVTLTVTIDGLMNDVSIVQYEIAYDEALVSTDTSGKNPKCFDADWYAEIKAETGLGYINTPVKSAVDGVFKAGFLSNDMYSIDSEADLYGKETAVAGKILFTVNADIADVSKVFTLQNTKIAQAIGGANVEKTVTAVQLKGAGSSEPEVPEVDEAVEAAIAAIAAIGEVAYTEQCEALIVAAENACKDLTDAQIAKVTNYADLQAARKAYDELKAEADKIAEDKAQAAAVDALIIKLPEDITLDDEAAVVAARKAYDALTDDAAAYVEKLDVLVAAEAKIAEIKKQNEENLQAAKDVEELINNLPEVTLKYAGEAEEAIVAARAAYKNLEEMNIANLVDANVYAKLVDAENELAEVKITLEAIDNVIALINALGEEITLESEDAIVEAEAAYAELSDEAKDLVTNYAVLLEARKTLDALAADERAVDEVFNLIFNATTKEITLDSEEELVAARKAYEALKDELKARVRNYQELVDAEAILANLKKVVAAEDLIDAIGEVTMDNYKEALPKIIAAEEAVKALESAGLSVNADKKAELEAAREAYDAIIADLDQDEKDRTAAAAVDALIIAIGEVTLESEDAINAAKAAYEALNDNAANYVENFDMLLKAIDAFNQLVEDEEAVQNVLDLIAAIGKVEYTEDCYARIKAAKVAYEDLAEYLVDRIENADVIYEAETLYRLLESVDYVVELIDAIGEVEFTADCLAKIEEAEAAVKRLNDEQLEAIADKIAELEAKRAAYDALVPSINAGEGYDGKTVVVIRDVTVPAGKTIAIGGQVASKVTVAGKDVYVVVGYKDIDYSITYVDGEAEELMLGDVDNDGELTAADALLTLKKVVMDVKQFTDDVRTYVKADVTGEVSEAKITARDARAIAVAVATGNADAFRVFTGGYNVDVVPGEDVDSGSSEGTGSEGGNTAVEVIPDPLPEIPSFN